jgi:hypothetical protein
MSRAVNPASTSVAQNPPIFYSQGEPGQGGCPDADEGDLIEMTRILGVCALGLGLATALGGCTNPYDPGQRAVGGGLIGAGTGAAIGGLAGGGSGAAAGALIGGAVGAIGGAATTPTPPPPAPYYAPPAGYYQAPPPGYYQGPPPGYYRY